VHQGDRHGAFADGRGDALDRAVADVTGEVAPAHENSHVHTCLAHADASTVDAALDELRELTTELQASRTRIVEAGE
jgi:hypothetical protein